MLRLIMVVLEAASSMFSIFDQWDLIRQAVTILLTPSNFIILIISAIVGLLTGAMPGIGPLIGMIIMFPVILTFDPAITLASITIIYVVGTFAGSISAILIRVPGTAGSVATILDGYEMTKNNQAATAIGISAFSSFLGVIIGLIFLAVFAPSLAKVSTLFGPPQFFLLAVLGIVIVIAVVRTPLTKTIISAGIGVWLAIVGLDPIYYEARFTFGSSYFAAGIHIIVLAVGLFAISQAITLAVRPPAYLNKTESIDTGDGRIVDGLIWTLRHPIQVIRSAFVGVGLGSLPGLGIVSANFFSYFLATKSRGEDKKFGSGEPEGVLAAETANNSAAIATLIPTMAIGIPGGVAAAIFLGIMVSGGIVPGPSVFEQPLAMIIFISILFSAFFILTVGAYISGKLRKLFYLPNSLIVSAIIILSLAGVFSIRSSMMDVWVAIIIGVGGYLLERRDYSVVTLIIVFVLTPIAEPAFAQSLILSRGDFRIFIDGYINKALLSVIIIISGMRLLNAYMNFSNRLEKQTIGEPPNDK